MNSRCISLNNDVWFDNTKHFITILIIPNTFNINFDANLTRILKFLPDS